MKTAKLVLIPLMMALSSAAMAVDRMHRVGLYQASKEVPTQWYFKRHLMGKAIAYLSSCSRYEELVGKPYSASDADKRLKKVIQGYAYLKIELPGGARLPIARPGLQEVSTLYIGFSSNGFPEIVTRHKGRVQTYVKCSGGIAVMKFQCDAMLSKRLQFRQDKKMCQRVRKASCPAAR